MKKASVILLTAALAFALAACNNSQSTASTPSSQSAASPQSSDATQAAEPVSGSMSAQDGEETTGALFAIQTDVVYPADGGALIDFAAVEQDEGARPGLTSHIEDLERYDTVFVGYPNWWYDMPMAMYSFFEEYDFSGKTIIPFNVHNGSRFSSTISTIQELEPEATVVEDGFTVSEWDVAEAAGDVAVWLDELGY